VNPKATDGSFSFEFTGLPGQTYSVEFTENLGATPFWLVLTNLSVPADGAGVLFSEKISSSRRFYRVVGAGLFQP
jgi:hypothetical protein